MFGHRGTVYSLPNLPGFTRRTTAQRLSSGPCGLRLWSCTLFGVPRDVPLTKTPRSLLRHLNRSKPSPCFLSHPSRLPRFSWTLTGRPRRPPPPTLTTHSLHPPPYTRFFFFRKPLLSASPTSKAHVSLAPPCCFQTAGPQGLRLESRQLRSLVAGEAAPAWPAGAQGAGRKGGDDSELHPPPPPAHTPFRLPSPGIVRAGPRPQPAADTRPGPASSRPEACSRGGRHTKPRSRPPAPRRPRTRRSERGLTYRAAAAALPQPGDTDRWAPAATLSAGRPPPPPPVAATSSFSSYLPPPHPTSFFSSPSSSEPPKYRG